MSHSRMPAFAGVRRGMLPALLVPALFVPALFVPALIPGVLQAQQRTGGRAVPAKAPVAQGGALNRMCAEVASSPTALVRTPEGRAVLRFKKDLEGMETSGRLERVDAQRLSELQRGLDSLMQVVVRTMTDEEGRERTVVTLRGATSGSASASGQGGGAGGAAIIGDGRATTEMRITRGQLEQSIRMFEPQVAALMESRVMGGPMRIPMPSGWMGVTLSRSSRDVPSPEGMLIYYCDYPVIEAVHAGSPAEKGGLLAGDTLLAYNGRDVRAAAVNLTALLVPKHVVRVRVSREGRQRELPITIGNRPEESMVSTTRSPCPPGVRCEPRVFVFETDTVRGMRLDGPGGLRPGEQNRVYLRSPSIPPAPPVDAMLTGTGMAVIAGAQLSTIDDEFARSMGVEPGVLALRIVPGTPFADAGLRPGEVIRAVNGVPIRDMTPLRRAFSGMTEREVKLTVMAKGASPRIIVVRW